MLRLASYDIVFAEIPGEVTLALNISGCPNGCPGCHSPHLQTDTGERLDETLLSGLLDSYGNSVTCVCFMGGDAEPERVRQLATFAREWRGDDSRHPEPAPQSAVKLKTAWYSGRAALPDCFPPACMDYIKLGPYMESLGGIDNPSTNQRLYRIEEGSMTDITRAMQKK